MRVKPRCLPDINNSDMHKKSASEGDRTDSDSNNVRELRLKLQHCQEEICKLQAVVTELTQVNKRWQKYNSDRQIYVQKLLNTIQDQQEQLNLIGEHSFTTSSEQTSSALEINIDSEIEKLQSVEKKLKEKISILEFQVKAHRDDWEAELNEKKQALRDKEAVEQRVEELLRKLETVNGGADHSYSEGSLVRVAELYCQNCGRVSEFDDLPPSRSRIYRTAVHLPCSSSQHSSTASILTNDEIMVDNLKGLDHQDFQYESGSKDLTKTWNVKCDETSYSRSSTFPLDSETIQKVPDRSTTTTNSSTCSVNEKPLQLSCNRVTVKSFVQIPIAKSSSVPEGRSTKFADLSRMSLDSFKFSSHLPPVSVVHSSDQYSGTETNTAENVICIRCGEVFPPEKHLKFLDHFPKCQSNRNAKLVSRDGSHRE